MDTERPVQQVYEFVYHLLPTLASEGVADRAAGFRSTIEKLGGSVISEEAPRSVELSYQMVKQIAGKNHRYNNAYVGTVKFFLDNEKAIDFKNEIAGNTEILRSMLIKSVKEAPKEKPRTGSVLREVATKSFERKIVKEEAKGPVSEAELDKSLEELVGEKI